MGCSGAPMRVPEAARATPGWAVEGYRERADRDHDFQLGGSSVHHLRRSKPPAKLAARTIEPSAPIARSYQFDLSTGGSTLLADCAELSEPSQASGAQVVGFGGSHHKLECVCREGALLRVELQLVDGVGTVALGAPAVRYRVTPARERADGKQSSEAIGYVFTNETGTGALERTGRGRAWPPVGLEPRASEQLRCAYAALFLYRPTAGGR
ncbi:MAG: hypothetical protein JWN04_5503 [Myxococcaceae bacterium]|nr:hypothetical protein [Myxococcaceae bacterium]